MNESQAAAILAMLKVNLGIKSTASYDPRLTQIIRASAKLIEREGATLDYSAIEDMQIICSYAEWLWRKRDTGEGMPRMLRWILNNRIFSEKMRAE